MSTSLARLGGDRRLDPIARRLLSTDHWRRSPASAGGPVGHKEWQHFCVLDGAVDVLINLSLMDGVQTGRLAAPEIARVAILARDRNGWRGALERFGPAEVDLAGGRLGASFGSNRLSFEDGRYRLEVGLDGDRLRTRLTLEPMMTPALTNHLRLGRGGSVRWLLVPRVTAQGSVSIDGREHHIRGALGYHDHNWGQFQWGGDFAWDWAIALPRESCIPWSLVTTRVTDRGRLHRFTDSLLLWRGDQLVRLFRGAGITSRGFGIHRPRTRPLRIPGAMWLAAPGTACDVPAHYEVRGEGQGDVVELRLEIEDFAQIALPDDVDDDGTTLFVEIRCEASVDGCVRGERVRFVGPALLELTHAAR
jgi:hypothetical protein